ncbi:MAG: ISNCY family transposase [Treponema sp.]|jgi:transposase|nr:ISNCY family transposase [Treponema sp.]
MRPLFQGGLFFKEENKLNVLNEREKYRKKIIMHGINGIMTNKQISMSLMITVRRICQIKAKYRKEGDAAFIHGNRGKAPVNKTNEAIKRQILDTKETVMDGVKIFEEVNFCHFAEILSEEYNIKVSGKTVAKILKEKGYQSPKKHRKKETKKLHLMRPRKESMGELVQADGSPFDWLGDGNQYCIQGFVDDATGIPVGLYMTRHECLLGYIEATRQMVQTYGIPQQLYPDRLGVFFINTKNKDDDGKKRLTQFGRMMEELGIDMFPAYSPQAKGRIERFWETIQSRLPVELKMRGIKTIEAANKFLPEFMEKYKRRFFVKPARDESLFVPVDQEEVRRINDLLVIKIPRKTDGAGVLSIQGYKFVAADCIRKHVTVVLSEKYGIYVTTADGSRHKMLLLEIGKGSKARHLPEVQKLLIHDFFLKDSKSRYRKYEEIEGMG